MKPASPRPGHPLTQKPMSLYAVSPLKFDGLKTYPLASRPSKIHTSDFAAPHRRSSSFASFLRGLPNILAAKDFLDLRRRLLSARSRHRPILWGIGGHVVKVGLAPILADLIRRGFISAIAMNGAALVHDFEIALSGGTSEDVDESLSTGTFGMAEETGLYLNEIAVGADRSGIGMGEAAGKLLTSGRLQPRYPSRSILIAAYRARVPVTIHLAIGTDIPHIHRSVSGAALGAASHLDFRLFCALVRGMNGGAYLNWGSAVILPEIFLKAVAVARNLGSPLRSITTANFDFIQHYRPVQNVVRRPTLSRGARHSTSRGFAFTGHHEIMLPLLAASLIEAGRRPSRNP
jgi:hypothetical protein